MNADSISSQREAVREDWAGRARHWDGRADQVAEPAARMNAPLIEAADIQTGQKVLDIATGAGEPGLTVAGLIGPDGHLTMSDMVPEMIAGAKRRAAAQEIANIEFVIADMANLPSDDNVFDRTICRFGLMFCPEKSLAVSEAFRVLKPGGRAAWMVWGPIENNSSFSVIDSAAGEVFGADNPLHDLERPFSLSDAGSLETLVRGAGFETEGEQDVKLFPKLPSDAAFWGPMIDMAAGRPRDAANPDQRAAFDAEVERRFAELITDGKYHISMHARICSGVKPG
jgi:SAM-dependent methyltransferase